MNVNFRILSFNLIFIFVLSALTGCKADVSENDSYVCTSTEIYSRDSNISQEYKSGIFEESTPESGIDSDVSRSTVSSVSSKVVSSASSRNPSSSKAQSKAPAVTSTAPVYTVSSFVGQSDDWRLLLANKNNVVKNYSPTVKKFDAKYCQDSVTAYQLDERAFDDAMDMILAAKKDGISLVILSSYRTYDRQMTLYKNKVKVYLNKGYSQKDAEEIASTIVAVPGTSDHNLGLAIDFNYLDEKYENKPSLVWLRNHAEEYGFVMRYPKSKQNITGVIYEPWHYRYVGKENAREMNRLNMCLEEYVEYLTN